MPADDSGSDFQINKLCARDKTILFGVIISSIALIFPWYSDVDSFNTGVKYTALNGPAALVGFTMLIINIVTIACILYYSKFKAEPNIPLKRKSLEKWGGIMYLYFALVINTIYFHSGFGVNISDKILGVGFYIGTVSSLIVAFTGFMNFVSERKNPHAEYFRRAAESEAKMAEDSNSGEITLDSIGSGIESETQMDDPILRERWRKQREIEAKLHSKTLTNK